MKDKKTISGKNLIYIAQEKAFAPHIAKGWWKIIPAPHTRNGRLVGLNIPSKLMKEIEEHWKKELRGGVKCKKA